MLEISTPKIRFRREISNPHFQVFFRPRPFFLPGTAARGASFCVKKATFGGSLSEFLLIFAPNQSNLIQ